MPWFSRRRKAPAKAELPSASPASFPSLAQPWRWDGRVIVPDPGLPLSSYEDPYGMWGSQPSVRKVVDFIARNLASIPWLVYRRRADYDREWLTEHPLARLLEQPGQFTTHTRLWHSVLVDYLLWDRWCVKVIPSAETDSGFELVRVPASRMRLHTDLYGRVDQVIVYQLDGKSIAEHPSGYLFDHGYATEGADGTSPLTTLANLLAENEEAIAYRRSIWQNQARMPSVIERPAEAPQWSHEARSRFREAWRRFLKGGGEEGGTPILEDGMRLTKVDAFAPRDTNDLEGRKLTDQEVAAAYHIAPELVGAREGNYSNVDAYRQMLYRDTLGPHITALEQVLNAMLVPLLGERDLYIEADVDVKLRGSFEEEAQVLQASTGAPWLTRNEARARRNLPAVDGGDELVTPLNVVTGGLASPRDTEPDSQKRIAPQAKAEALASYEREREALTATLSGQLQATADSLRADLTAPVDPVTYFADDYDPNLAGVIAGHGKRLASLGAGRVLDRYNPKHEGWSENGMDAWLAKAGMTHATQIRAALSRAIGEAGTDGQPWERALASRLHTWAGKAPQWAGAISLETESFGAQDAAQVSGLDTKTWHAGDDQHADLDGLTVDIGGVFPGNLRWPGDPIAGSGQTVGCRCAVTYSRSAT